jgi:hypothetical protein
MAQYYEEASQNLSNWISDDARREDDFFELPDLLEHETLTQYLARNAYRPNIIVEIIERLMRIATDRAISNIQPSRTSS